MKPERVKLFKVQYRMKSSAGVQTQNFLILKFRSNCSFDISQAKKKSQVMD